MTRPGDKNLPRKVVPLRSTDLAAMRTLANDMGTTVEHVVRWAVYVGLNAGQSKRSLSDAITQGAYADAGAVDAAMDGDTLGDE